MDKTIDIKSLRFKILHWLKRLSQKIVIRNQKSIRKDDYIIRSEYEREAVMICRMLITKNPDSELRVAPISGERRVENIRLNIVIFINEASVDIIKDNYPQNVPISPKAKSIIVNMFDNYAEMDRERTKEKIKAKLKLSLKSILDDSRQLNKVKAVVESK